MAQIDIRDGNLVVTVKGIRRFLTLKKELVFPLERVKGATHDPSVNADFPRGWEKRKGTNIFNTYYGGTYRQAGETIFWDVWKPENTVVITLDDDNYQRLMVDTDNPRDIVRMIESALQA